MGKFSGRALSRPGAQTDAAFEIAGLEPAGEGLKPP